MTTVGLCLPQLGSHVDRTTLRGFCERAEELGFASLWVQEHLFYPLAPRSGYAAIPGQPVPTPYESALAATETLSAAAAWTERVDIGTSVLVMGYHRPVELAQRLATLDVLSAGRLIAGLGVGWSEEEHEQMEVDASSRGARADELVPALLACWGPDPVAFEGRFFSIPESLVRPKPLQTPRPRLLSGMRSKAGMERTAQFFDIWNPSRGSVETIRGQLHWINGRRPQHLAPLQVYQRVFLAPSVPVPGEPPLGPAGVAHAVEQARDAGFASVILDANFWEGVDSPRAWAGLPDLLARHVDLRVAAG